MLNSSEIINLCLDTVKFTIEKMNSFTQVVPNTYTKKFPWGFPGGAVVKNPPANAGDTGSSPGPGISHMPWSN